VPTQTEHTPPSRFASPSTVMICTCPWSTTVAAYRLRPRPGLGTAWLDHYCPGAWSRSNLPQGARLDVRIAQAFGLGRLKVSSG